MKTRILLFAAIFTFSMVASVGAWNRNPPKHEKRIHGKHHGYTYIKKHRHLKRFDRHRKHSSIDRYNKKMRRRAFHRHLHRSLHRRPYAYEKRYRWYRGNRYVTRYGFSSSQSGSPYPHATESNPSTPSAIRPKTTPPAATDPTGPHSDSKPPGGSDFLEDSAASMIWIPAREEQIWVPGYWSYGIRKVWREDHWHFETDPDVKSWVEGHYVTRVVESGYYESR